MSRTLCPRRQALPVAPVRVPGPRELDKAPPLSSWRAKPNVAALEAKHSLRPSAAVPDSECGVRCEWPAGRFTTELNEQVPSYNAAECLLCTACCILERPLEARSTMSQLHAAFVHRRDSHVRSFFDNKHTFFAMTSQARRQSRTSEYGELTEDLVKAATGKFDVITVFKFVWCNKALQVRGSVQWPRSLALLSAAPAGQLAWLEPVTAGPCSLPNSTCKGEVVPWV